MLSINFSPKIQQQQNIKRPYNNLRASKGDIAVFKTKTPQIKDSSTKADKNYRKEICTALNIAGINAAKIQSVMAPDEFRDFIKENSNCRNFYIAGERPEGKSKITDSNKIENVKMRIFGANLHTHTTNSDGKLTVQELLDEAADYADDYKKANDKPFVIGITDHNTIEGAKQAVKILASNPEKYKNLKVVLGCEISAKEDTPNGKQFQKPLKFHILTSCINPFDEKLNNFLDDMAGDTPCEPKKVSLNEIYNALQNQPQSFISLAHPLYMTENFKNPNKGELEAASKEGVKCFKNSAKEKALYAENYYGAYSGAMADNTVLADLIQKETLKYGLYNAGGLDTHGLSIYFSE